MIQLSYSTFGLTDLPILEAIDAVAQAGYAGIELAFHRHQFNPFDISSNDLDAVRRRLYKTRIAPACIATASHFFTPSRPHEPSLMTLDVAGRKRRIDLIKRGIWVARHVGAPLVTFGSGFLREEHVHNPAIDPGELLVSSIRECLGEIHKGEDITLLIEPEPGMYIETLEQGMELVDLVDSERFALHIDICHAYCSESDYITALGSAVPCTRYLHISDAREGYNLKIMEDDASRPLDEDAMSVLVYFPDTADFLLVDDELPMLFCEQAPKRAELHRIEALLSDVGVTQPWRRVDYSILYAGASPLDTEISTYLVSIPKLSFDVLERARPIIAYLRGVRGPVLVDRMVANTRTGMVHFHDIPGTGTLDLGACFRNLVTHGFHGYGSVELYHHVDDWQHALTQSYRHLAAIPQPT